jgi:hypothetical protein
LQKYLFIIYKTYIAKSNTKNYEGFNSTPLEKASTNVSINTISQNPIAANSNLNDNNNVYDNDINFRIKDDTLTVNNNNLVELLTDIMSKADINTIKKYMEIGLTNLKDIISTIPTVQKSSTNSNLLYNYLYSLVHELIHMGLLNSNDVSNIKLKLQSKLASIEEIIISLEKLKKLHGHKLHDNKLHDNKLHDNTPTPNYNIQNELPPDFFVPVGDKIANDWENDYTILNTNKWQVPIPRPPVCINNTPCKVCPLETSNYSTNLQQWDEARYVLQKP